MIPLGILGSRNYCKFLIAKMINHSNHLRALVSHTEDKGYKSILYFVVVHTRSNWAALMYSMSYRSNAFVLACLLGCRHRTCPIYKSSIWKISLLNNQTLNLSHTPTLVIYGCMIYLWHSNLLPNSTLTYIIFTFPLNKDNHHSAFIFLKSLFL